MFHDFHVRKGVIWLYGWTGEQVENYDDAGATMARCIETIEDALEATYGSSTDN